MERWCVGAQLLKGSQFQMSMPPRSVPVAHPARMFALSVALIATTLAITPSASLASRAKPHQPRIYINNCGPELEPPAFGLWGGCSSSPAPPPLSTAYGLVYRHYGTRLALASGMVDVCLGPGSEVLEWCFQLPQDRAERGQSYRSFPAAFRFFDVLSCTSQELPAPHLYYGKFSFRFAGRPWETHAFVIPNRRYFWPGPAKCHPVRLSKR
jgi:hypothetical protein